MGARQGKDKSEDLQTLPVDKQLALLTLVLSAEDFDAKSLERLKLFNALYHPAKDFMMNESRFNSPPLINLLISRFLTFDRGDLSFRIEVLTATIHTLGLLARQDLARYSIIEAQAIPLIISAIRSHMTESALVEYSLFAMGNLSLHTEGKTAIMELDAINLIAKIMSRQKDHAGVLERACFTLGNLAYHESCKRAIMESGCVQAVAKSAPLHGDKTSFLLETCFFFSNMAVIPAGRSLVISLGGLQIVVAAMKRDPKCTELLDLACTAIYNMSLDPTGRKIIDEMDVLEIMMFSIASNLHSPSFLTEAIGSIGRLFFDTDANITRLVKSHGSELALEAMKRHPSEFLVIATSTAVLTQLSGCDDIKFETVPEIPALKELCGRVILNGPPKPVENLPYDLQEYLKGNTHRCDSCGGVWIDSRYELIVMAPMHGFERPLPAYRQLCSQACFLKMKAPPIQSPPPEPIVQFHAH